jgi:hypothetical protein
LGLGACSGYVSSLQAATHYTSRPVEAVGEGGALRTLGDALDALLPALCPPGQGGAPAEPSSMAQPGQVQVLTESRVLHAWPLQALIVSFGDGCS